MSRTYILAFKQDGDYEDGAEFQNSYGSAMFVWSALSRRYLGLEHAPLFNPKQEAELWALYDDPRLAPFEKFTLEMTLDGAILLDRDRPQLVKDLRAFARHHNPDGKWVCSLGEQADYLERANGYLGFAWIQTTVADDYWYRHIERDGQEIEVTFNLRRAMQGPAANAGIQGFLMYGRTEVTGAT